jgi:LysM repeat protein
MKILQIFGWVVGVHLIAFIFIFASPGCQAGPSNPPTPDATLPSTPAAAPVSYAAQPADLGTPAVSFNAVASTGSYAAPTRPGSANAVAITPAKAAENVAPVSTYTVERGDSLWSIAKKHGLTVSELAKANNVTSGTALKPGRKLIIPGKPGQPAAAEAPAAEKATAEKAAVATKPANGEAVKHTVQTGESLGIIARKYGVTVGELAAANNITDPSKVRAGQQLVIPGFKSTGTKGTATTSTKPAPTAAKPATATPAPAAPAKPAEAAPHFEVAPPPPGQDLDSGLKSGETEVPTIKVEEPAPATPPTN